MVNSIYIGLVDQKMKGEPMRKYSIIVVAIAVLVLAACGSTKVYTAEKTMTYKGSLYTLTGASKISSHVNGETSEGELLDLRSVNKAQFKALVEKHGVLEVTTSINIADEAVVAQTATVEKYSDLEKMTKNLNSKMGKIAKFMKDKKDTQLNLK
ncbi:MAG: hypothetical protein DRJ65_07435 [Acidobacteria bacterium]|nr:MAG: hypothetical protein DRJ65_07435 [Acidobacteriota bacterium]